MTGFTNPQAAGDHCASANSPTSFGAVPSVADEPERLELTIAGMTCGHCISAVRDALQSLPGVQVDHVRLGNASVTLAADGASPASLIEAIREAGYRAGFSASAETDGQAGLPQAATSGSCCSSR